MLEMKSENTIQTFTLVPLDNHMLNNVWVHLRSHMDNFVIMPCHIVIHYDSWDNKAQKDNFCTISGWITGPTTTTTKPFRMDNRTSIAQVYPCERITAQFRKSTIGH
jgi:hypothetical protein|uniref:Uncharacterized protein n=1 Tax=Zea mays TaxID=4577 RepID=A0A804MNM9_MAIZE